MEEEPWHDFNFFSMMIRRGDVSGNDDDRGGFFFEIQIFAFFSDAHSSDIRFAVYLMIEKSWIAKKNRSPAENTLWICFYDELIELASLLQ